MLGIGCPDRHALLFTRSPQNRTDHDVYPPARAGSFFDPEQLFEKFNKLEEAGELASGRNVARAKSSGRMTQAVDRRMLRLMRVPSCLLAALDERSIEFDCSL